MLPPIAVASIQATVIAALSNVTAQLATNYTRQVGHTATPSSHVLHLGRYVTDADTGTHSLQHRRPLALHIDDRNHLTTELSMAGVA